MTESPSCPACAAEDTGLLGLLGRLAHWRCRLCGVTFNSKVTK